MSLLETITIAKSESQTPKTPSKHSIILNPDPIFSLLKPDPKSSSNNLINPITGWQISAVDSHIIESNHRFFSKLKRKLKSPNTLTSDEFFRILNSFLEKTREGISLSIGVGPTDPDYTRLAISKLAFVISRDVAGLISEACVALGLWELTDALIAHGLVVGCSSSVNLIEDLIRKNRSNSICLYIRSVSDLRSSELLLILKYFLSPSKDGYNSMISVRKEWERLAILSTEKVVENTLTKEKSRLARRAAVLLMMAHDGFSAYELCLHYLFGSKNVDGLALSWAVARLDGSEVLRLVKYLGKWLRKYEKFPEAGPCPGAVALGLEACEWVPTVDSIVGCLAVVLDEHFSYLALYNELHEEMRSMEKLVRSFTAEAELCCSVASLIENLRADAGSRGVKKLVVELWDEPTGPPLGGHWSSCPFYRRCAPGLNWPGHATGAATLKKLECSKQAQALDTQLHTAGYNAEYILSSVLFIRKGRQLFCLNDSSVFVDLLMY